jgi:hypothetical protein
MPCFSLTHHLAAIAETQGAALDGGSSPSFQKIVIHSSPAIWDNGRAVTFAKKGGLRCWTD